MEVARDRSRRVARATEARRRFPEAADRRTRERTGGRAWLNGGELGGARAAFTHLAEIYD